MTEEEIKIAEEEVWKSKFLGKQKHNKTKQQLANRKNKTTARNKAARKSRKRNRSKR
jgi:hypothetical protein